MIVTVTPNPAIDVTISAETILPGASHSIPTAVRRAGGKSLNVARVLAQTGHSVIALGLVGADELQWFAADLPVVDTRLTPCEAPTRSTFAVVETGIGRTTQLNERGNARTAAEWHHLVDSIARASAGASCLVVSGSLPPGSPDDAVTRMLEAGRAAGAPVIVDMTGPALLAAATAGAEVLKPNLDELRDTVGITDPVAGARVLQTMGAGLVVVSLGEEGLVAVPRDASPVHARLDTPLRGNATGAGDAAVAAIAAALDDGRSLSADLPEIAQRAVAWSAAAVLAPLAGSLDPAYADLLARVHVSLSAELEP